MAICLSAMLATSQNPPRTPTDAKPVKSERIILQRHTRYGSKRPQAPSRQHIGCQYDGEYLIFDFVYSEGICTADLTEMATGYTQTYTFDSDDLTAEIHVGELYESTVTLTTEAGNTYTADLTAE